MNTAETRLAARVRGQTKKGCMGVGQGAATFAGEWPDGTASLRRLAKTSQCRNRIEGGAQ